MRLCQEVFVDARKGEQKQIQDIVPFTDEIKGSEAIKNPSSLRVKVYAGADGSFELYGFQEVKEKQLEVIFLKDQIYALLQREKRIHVLMTELQVMNLNEKLLAVLMEMITAKDSLQKRNGTAE